MLSPSSYKLPLLISIILHGLAVSLLFVHWPEKKQIKEPVPQHVTAEVIMVESAAEKERKQKIEQQKKRQQEVARQQALQKKKQAEQKKREEAAKAAAAKKRKDEALKAQAEANKKEEALQKAKQKQAEQAKAEQQQKLAQQAAEQALQEKLLQEQLAAEQKAQEEARKQAERASALEADFMEQIKAHVSSHWRYPSVVQPEQEVTVRITLVPTGQVIQVVVIKSSGNLALDRSVEQAIHRASPLPTPKDFMVFEKSFRQLTMKFRPENASW